MDRRGLILAAASVAAVGFSAPALADKAPTEWDGLVRVKSKQLKYVYLLPGADFRGYTKVMIDPTELAFQKDWLRNYNNSTMSLSSRISAKDVQDAIAKAAPVATEILADAFRDGGFPVVTEGAPDVLRVRTAVTNISINAPDVNTAGRSRTFAGEAGYATLVVEVRDSVSGALLGRAVDSEVAGDNGALVRNSVTNRGDFRQLMKRWANISVKGMAELKARSPINDQGVGPG